MKIQIQEIKPKDIKDSDKALTDFNPIKCLTCSNKKKIIQGFFQLNIPVKNESIHKKVKKILMDKYGLTYYGYQKNFEFYHTP